jgi:hypothetical protein
MSKYGSPQVTITLDDSGGTPRLITQFVLTMGALKSTPIALGGIYDDTATVGTAATLVVTDADAVPGFTRTLSIVIGGGHTYLAEVILSDSSLVPKTGNLSDFAATLTPTGVITIS